MARKQKKKTQTGDEMKKPVNSLSFVVKEDPEILFEVNEILKLKSKTIKSAKPAVREVVLKALTDERIKLTKLNQAG